MADKENVASSTVDSPILDDSAECKQQGMDTEFVNVNAFQDLKDSIINLDQKLCGRLDEMEAWWKSHFRNLEQSVAETKSEISEYKQSIDKKLVEMGTQIDDKCKKLRQLEIDIEKSIAWDIHIYVVINQKS